MLKIQSLLFASVLLLLLVSCGGGSADPVSMDDRDTLSGRTEDLLGVAVSPQAFLLSSDQGGYVTVHTDVPLSKVAADTLDLNGVPVHHWKADARGCVVGFFPEWEVKGIVTPPEEIMTLSGYYKDGLPFSGCDTVKVIP